MIAIRAEDLGKQYRIGARVAANLTLREALADAVRAPFRAARRAPADTIWALRDVSFEVRHGEILGIIGRNGAGKSTLLKILSRITRPTAGYADLRGRVGSLLEVGTGFHPELTGRENVFLNGAILGMPRVDIRRRFDEIVAFAEVDKFIDTPVKHYSSGMYLRLAFAVAAHLEPDILLVDEVLAVGDAVFQRKCLGKMQNVAREGRTVLFVSHNLAAVGSLCERALMLQGGQVNMVGPAPAVVASYLSSGATAANRMDWPDTQEAPGDEFLRLLSLSILDEQDEPPGSLHQDRAFAISIAYRVHQPMRIMHVGCALRSSDGTTVFTSYDADSLPGAGLERAAGVHTSSCIVPAQFLNEGEYYLSVIGGIPATTLSFRVEDALRVVVHAPLASEASIGRMGFARPGVTAPRLQWKVSIGSEQSPGRAEQFSGALTSHQVNRSQARR
jgi:lipopolysaccharide transport system ATP-binding protein